VNFELLAIIVSVGVSLLGWIEMRLSAVRKELLEQIQNKQQVDSVIQESIKEDLLRLEKKLDDLTEKLFKLKVNKI